jgi:uncharacterized BrkB/YihY/UPF0761 family membrane protein
MPRREDEFEPMPLDPRVERAVRWLREHVPGGDSVLLALERETTAGGTLIAGGLAYRLFLWLLPFGLVVAAIASFWPGDVESSADNLGMSAESAHTMTEVIEESSHGHWYFLALGLFFLLWFAIGVARALRVAHTLAWGVQRRRFRRPVHGGLVFTLFATALIATPLLLQWAREALGVGGLIATISVVALYAAGALWMMLLLPHPPEVQWTALIPGAVLVGVGVEGLHLFTALYLAPRLGRSDELYGSLGAATVLLLWLYIIARLITLSAFLNATLWERRHGESA